MAEAGVLALGEAMILVTPTTPTPLEEAGSFRLEVAGAELNVATHLARLGHGARWAGAVGDDPLGRRLLAAVATRGVDGSLARVDPGAPTGVYFKDPHPDGTRVWYYRAGSAFSRLGADFAATLPLADVELVHVSGITAALSDSCQALIGAVIATAREAGTRVSFDVNYRPALWPPAAAGPLLLELARCSDVVFVGRDEAETLWGTAAAGDVRALLEGPAQLVVKDGAVGAHCYDADGECFVPAPAVDVVEPVGAGDAFAGGYLAAMLDGEPPARALEHGHRLAAITLATTADVGGLDDATPPVVEPVQSTARRSTSCT